MKKIALALALANAASAHAQDVSVVYRLGKDTVAIERSTKTPTRMTGEVLNRQGTLIVRTQYDGTLHDGKLTQLNYKVVGADGNPVAGRAREVRYEIMGDSVKRTVVWADSSSVRTFAAVNAMPFIASAYTMLEMPVAMMRRNKMTTATFPALSTNAGQTLAQFPITLTGGDTARQPSGLVMLFDRGNLLQSVDGMGTTAKIFGTRSNAQLNIAAMSAGMKPTGVLSQRGTARAAFQTQLPGGVIMIDYGRPLVRDRTVWGGTLIPLDTIWRLGANDATHFATGRDLDFNGVAVPAGLYTLFLYNAKSGPVLVVNKQTGQWGTAYDQARDLVRIPLTMSAAAEFAEEFTINIRQAAPNRGSLEFVWGQQMAMAPFTVR